VSKHIAIKEWAEKGGVKKKKKKPGLIEGRYRLYQNSNFVEIGEEGNEELTTIAQRGRALG